MNFATLKGLTIPEGNVTQITDASGRVIWAVSGGKVILEVEKITSSTYAGGTTYENESFILLDIYPKTNGTVSVTYGGLTKTITDTSGAEEPNAQQVFFGTFNGVSDSVATPTSGELTIDGDYYAFGCGIFNQGGKVKLNLLCLCVKSIDSFGNTIIIPDNAFGSNLGGCSFTTVTIPDTISSIGKQAFTNCNSLQTVTIGKGVVSIGFSAFNHISENTLSTVIMRGVTPPELGIGESSDTYANFGVVGGDGFKLEQIIVPKGCGNTYKTAEGWSTYAEYIVEAS